MADPLAQIVGLLQPGAPFSKCVTGSGPWRVRRTQSPNPYYVAVLKGSLQYRDHQSGEVIVNAGDFILIPAGRKFRQMVRLGTQGNRVAKAVAWLRNHFREPLKIEQLADVAGMAESTLYRHFHELTGMSPIQYQKRLRLHEARRLMLESGLDVGSAALSVGYESSTQFIREYRRLFGEPPLRDVKALRANGHLPQVL